MEKDLDLDNASIQELADQINTAISGVSNVEQVWRIADTLHFCHVQCFLAENRLKKIKVCCEKEQVTIVLVNIPDAEQILEDTDEDLAKARELRQEAVEVQTEAQTQLDKVNNITGDLGSALEAQYDADQNIQRANADIDSARENLSKVSNIF